MSTYGPIVLLFLLSKILIVPVVARFKAWVCGRSLTGIMGSNPAGGMDVCLFLSAVCCQVERSASGWSLVQRSPNDSGVFECDHESLTMRRPSPTGGCCDVLKKFN
jgi:hypothetical protein